MLDGDKLLEIKNKRIRLNVEGFKGEIYPFQQTGIAYLYFVERGNLLDICGSGKTIQGLGLLQLLKNRDELTKGIVFVLPQSVNQWLEEARRFTNLDVVAAKGTKAERRVVYTQGFDVIIVPYTILLRDESFLRDMGYNIIINDEAAYFRNYKTKTAKAMLRMASGTPRIINMTATPIQNTLVDIHTLFRVLGLEYVLGGRNFFRKKYLKEIELTGFTKKGKKFRYIKLIGYKNWKILQEKIAPYFIRRTLKDIDRDLPSLTAVDRWVDMLPAQKRLYKEFSSTAKKGISKQKIGNIIQSIHTLQMIVDTPYCLDKPDDSAKLDLLMELLTEDLVGQKAVVFCRYRKTIDAVKKRLEKAKIGYVTITGAESKDEKTASQKQFWDDPATLVCLGTTALEMSLNLQASAYMIALNQMWNPTRVEQLVGRIRRFGSEHSKVILVNIMVRDSIEEKIPQILRERAAVPNAIFGEESEIFKSLSKKELLLLLGE